jgi:hypothetical protein
MHHRATPTKDAFRVSPSMHPASIALVDSAIAAPKRCAQKIEITASTEIIAAIAVQAA